MGGMIVNHNMSSMFQHRRLKVNAQKVQESSEKLASGYKINHAMIRRRNLLYLRRCAIRLED